VRVEISKRAQRSIERIDARWRSRADYPDIFMDEMDAAIGHLETVSNPGTPCNSPKRPQLRRLLLEKTKCHLYFVVNEQKQWIELLQVWDSRREHPPKL
jgi:hypothetical protein